jgi:ABC-2 type transport system permease protein
MSQVESIPEPAPVAVRPLTATQPFYWSIRRELWENRSLYIAPLVIAGLVLFGFTLSRVGVVHVRTNHQTLDPSQAHMTSAPYDFVGIAVLVTGLIVSLFYSLGALHNERRDRSILFWKSLPVSDLTTVAAKASIPLAVQPIIGSIVIILTQLLILLIAGASRLAGGGDGAIVPRTPLPNLWLMLLYFQATFVLWYAPIYAWCLLVSAWARRAPFLWAVLPPLALCLLEKVALNTTYAAGLLKYRLVGGFWEAVNVSAFATASPDGFSVLNPARFFTSPGLWSGLVFSAVVLAAAVWLRRRREPL